MAVVDAVTLAAITPLGAEAAYRAAQRAGAGRAPDTAILLGSELLGFRPGAELLAAAGRSALRAGWRTGRGLLIAFIASS